MKNNININGKEIRKMLDIISKSKALIFLAVYFGAVALIGLLIVFSDNVATLLETVARLF